MAQVVPDLLDVVLDHVEAEVEVLVEAVVLEVEETVVRRGRRPLPALTGHAALMPHLLLPGRGLELGLGHRLSVLAVVEELLQGKASARLHLLMWLLRPRMSRNR